MAHRFIFFACVQVLFLQHALSQAINFPKCGCQPQVTVNQPCQVVAQQNYVQPCQPVCQSQATYPAITNVATPCDCVASCGLPCTTIIQDDTIANELANTLQLLIVSNLLGNTLPNNELLLRSPLLGQPAIIGQPLLGSLGTLAVPGLVGCDCGGCGGYCGCGCGGCGCVGCGCGGCGCGGCGYII